MNELESLRKMLAPLSPDQGLSVVAQTFGVRARFSSALGLEDQVIAHWIGTAKLKIEVFTLDTGRLFQETYDLLMLTRQQYGLPIKVYYPQTDAVEKMVTEKGPNSFYDSVENRKECCAIRKVEPLKRALVGASVWITGIRGDQSTNRGQMQLVEWDEAHNVIKYNPLLHWSLQDVEKFIQDHHVPVNALHNKGYPSIGCAPCTRAIMPGEDFRAGRWWWENSAKECGLHETRKGH